ncbi:hypothetical protein DAEQUDRAFT_143556 [Daedalea quercina L-15889]|uniref:Uncharacterized protein n=1 Tax=Daedalea quercina L-15889 TaxID=1314783 RepID=A0A165RW12_9APHY|nr:hypothetical protein DAEQUDRAFT_143556 [Daedalea quercina L-15889]
MYTWRSLAPPPSLRENVHTLLDIGVGRSWLFLFFLLPVPLTVLIDILISAFDVPCRLSAGRRSRVSVTLSDTSAMRRTHDQRAVLSSLVFLVQCLPSEQDTAGRIASTEAACHRNSAVKWKCVPYPLHGGANTQFVRQHSWPPCLSTGRVVQEVGDASPHRQQASSSTSSLASLSTPPKPTHHESL